MQADNSTQKYKPHDLLLYKKVQTTNYCLVKFSRQRVIDQINVNDINNIEYQDTSYKKIFQYKNCLENLLYVILVQISR